MIILVSGSINPQLKQIYNLFTTRKIFFTTFYNSRSVEEFQHSDKDNSKRILLFRQNTYLLTLAGYAQVEMANKLDVTRDNFNRYYKDPAIFPGSKFLDKFDEVFGEDLLRLKDYLKMYKKGKFPNVEEPSDEYILSGLANNYIESLKDQIVTLKSDREFCIDQISFLKDLITRHLPEDAPGKPQGEVAGNFRVRLVQPENEAGQSDNEISPSTQ